MKIIKLYKEKINHISNSSILTNKLGLARSLLAFGTLSSLIFNNANFLFFSSGKKIVPNATATELSYTLFNLFGQDHIGWAKVTCILILIIIIAGIYPRYTCFLHWYVSWSFFNSTAIIDGGDQVTAILTLLLIPICITDKRSNHWKRAESDESQSIWSRYFNISNYSFYVLIRIQTCLLYFEAAIGKFKIEQWYDGTAVYYWLNQTWFGAPSYIKPIADILIKNVSGVVLLTWGTIAFELILFMALFMSMKRRQLMLLLGIVFHFSFLIFFGLFSFYFAMFGALILYLSNLNTNFNIKKLSWTI